MSDDALTRARPDIELVVWRAVRHLGNVITWNIGASELDNQGWATTENVQVDCRAHNRERARTMSDEARRLIKALPFRHLDDVVVARVDCTDGPRWLPDENGGPRYVARFALVHHPLQGMNP